MAATATAAGAVAGAVAAVAPGTALPALAHGLRTSLMTYLRTGSIDESVHGCVLFQAGRSEERAYRVGMHLFPVVTCNSSTPFSPQCYSIKKQSQVRGFGRRV